MSPSHAIRFPNLPLAEFAEFAAARADRKAIRYDPGRLGRVPNCERKAATVLKDFADRSNARDNPMMPAPAMATSTTTVLFISSF
jgi:hypothetical protein